MRTAHNLILATVSLVALATPALAQQTIASDQDVDNAAESQRVDKNEIVVTGTLIRGNAPTGTNVVALDKSAVEATGASTVTQLLQTVPSMGSFNSLQAPQGNSNQVTTNRPNLRSLPSSNLVGTAATLVLVDGHRVVGMGLTVTSPDLDTIAPGAIERVDIVPDGGSSTYGSDAVGGVINFITRKTFDGVGVDGRFGFADNYQTWDANATVGKTWNGGGIYVSYNYSQHDPIFGRDRDYVRQFETQSTTIAIPTIGLECVGGSNVQIINSSNQVQDSFAIYGLPYTPSAAAKRNQPNQCDYSDNASIYPQERRHAVFARLSQELSDSLSFDVTGFYTDRKQRQTQGYLRATKAIGTSPGRQINYPGRSNYIINAANEAHSVSFAWGDPDSVRQDVRLRAWGITPTFTAKLDDNWQARLLFNYGESDTIAHNPKSNDTALTNAIAAGLFNPYDPSSDKRAWGELARWESFGQAKQSQLQARMIVDGDLFQLPAGPMKVALGAEIIHETFRNQTGDIVAGTEMTGFAGSTVNGSTILPAGQALPVRHASRTVKSVFGEMVLPLAADEPMLQDLTVSFSARYDSYSDFGGTFNPKVGLTWKPVEQLRLRGQWGRSFSAPSLANSASADPTRATWVNGAAQGYSTLVTAAGQAVLTSRGYPGPIQQVVLALTGGSDTLQPQTAQTWSAGFDLDPVPGARLSLTYWNIKIKDVLGVPAFSNSQRYFEQFTGAYTVFPDQAAINQALAEAGTNIGNSPCNPQPQCVYILERNLTQNLGKYNQDGFDASASYRTDTGFGSADLSMALTYVLNREQSTDRLAPLFDQLAQGVSKMKIRTTLGANIDKLRAQVTWSHSSGYDLTPVDPALLPFYPEQSHVDAFDTVDLFFKYDFAGEGAMKDLALTLGINNLLDADPPVRFSNGQGFTNGNTVGRLVQLGFSKRF